jgi:hypothetical protein
MAIRPYSSPRQVELDLEQSQGRYLTSQQYAYWKSRNPQKASEPFNPDIPAEPFIALRAKVQDASPQSGSPLLNAPWEVMSKILRFVEEDISALVLHRTDWDRKPIDPYLSLRLVSRQLYHELERVEWQPWRVTQHRIQELIKSHYFKGKLSYNKVTDDFSLVLQGPDLKKLHSLILEIPHNATNLQLQGLRVAFQALPIKHLSLHFVGSDNYSTPTVSAVSCGLRPEDSSRSLPSSGQLFTNKGRLLNSLGKVRQLETLVVSNANLPVTYNQVVNNKKALKKLFIVSDSRTSLSHVWHNTVYSHPVPALASMTRHSAAPLDGRNLPAIEELQISANAMVHSSNVVLNVMNTLKKLTWIVPNPAHQCGDLQNRDLDWIKQTSSILSKAAFKGKQLETLRICIEGPVYDTFELERRNDKHEVGQLVNTLNTELKNSTAIKNFEIHMNYVPQFDRDSFLFTTNLPKCLERLFVSEQTFTIRNYEIPYAHLDTLEGDFDTDRPGSEDHPTHGYPSHLSVHHYLARQVTLDNFGVSSFSTVSWSNDIERSADEKLDLSEPVAQPIEAWLQRINNASKEAFNPSVINAPSVQVEPDTLQPAKTTLHVPSTRNPHGITPAQEEYLTHPQRRGPRTTRINRLKNLAFLSYEWTDPSTHHTLRILESTDSSPITPPPNTNLPEYDADRFRLLRLNGRLLDRHRNAHVFVDGYRPPVVWDANYELPADPEELETRHYPVVVRFDQEGKGDGEHWMCK